jgi:hypothetical protein
MKRNFSLLIILMLFSGINLMPEPLFAAWGKKAEEKKPGIDYSRAAQELSKKEWIIAALPFDPRKLPLQTTDVLAFTNGKFVSKNFLAQGYPAADYTFSVREDGSTVWETMLSNEKNGLISWRGELKDGVMQGAYSVAPSRGEIEDFSFTSITLSR